MLTFLIAFCIRVASGIQNAYNYKEDTVKRDSMSAVLGITTFIVILGSDLNVISLTVGGIWLFSFLGLTSSLSGKYMYSIPPDVHMFEFVYTGSMMLFLASSGCELIPLVCSVYPGLLVHKGAINWGSDKDFWYEGTDDQTGESFGIPYLGITIKRLPNKWRITLAIISIALMGWWLTK